MQTWISLYSKTVYYRSFVQLEFHSHLHCLKPHFLAFSVDCKQMHQYQQLNSSKRILPLLKLKDFLAMEDPGWYTT